MARYTATIVSCLMLVLSVGLSSAPPLAQRATPAEAAERLSGTWDINMDLSPQLRPAGGGRQGSAGLGGWSPLASIGSPRATLGLQRGGGRGGGGGAAAAPDPRVIAGNRALQSFQQVAPTMTIAATADTVTFTDPRGTRTYDVNNKNARVDLDDEAFLTTKTRWDRSTLRQDFIFDETRVSHAFELNDEGTRLTFTMRIDNFSGGVGRQVRGVYDKREAR